MANYYLDLTGFVCPVPLIRTKEKIKELADGDILSIKTEHPRAVRNIMDWAYHEGYSFDVDDEENGVWFITLRKGQEEPDESR
ncbi:MAG: sulfurtransferase TusA family protein [Bacillota bacterium]|nr:sulfurtransferase TusA family protein [Clostridia bacterium]